MIDPNLLSFSAAGVCAALAAAVLFCERRSPAAWLFFAGMVLFAVDAGVSGIVLARSHPEQILTNQRLVFLLKSFTPGVWLAFSLIYSRGNYPQFLRRWRWVLAAAVVVPLGLSVGFHQQLLHWSIATEAGERWLEFGFSGRVLNILLLCCAVLVLTNLEKTYQQTAGTMRWRVKFVVLGLGVIFGARIYTRSQSLLFAHYDLSLGGIESSALIVGCVLLAIGQVRKGLSAIDVYPSYAVIEKSVTILLVGGYLCMVGILAQVTRWLGGSDSFHLQVLLILAGVAVLGGMLLSERIRQQIRYIVSRHFKRPQHDFRKVWTGLTEKLTTVRGEGEFSTAAANVLSETFNALSVRVWLLNAERERLVLTASTVISQMAGETPIQQMLTSRDISEMAKSHRAVDLETVNASWGHLLRACNVSQFRTGDNRIALPLVANGRLLGVAVLADRVYRMPYTVEELDLAKCMADQLAAGLLNLQLSRDLLVAKEFETFQTMSAFFVHDLKNAASSLNLMLANLPLHFDNPDFREDALRGLGKVTGRINDLIGRLSTMRKTLDLHPGKTDLNQLIREALAQLAMPKSCEIHEALSLDKPVHADREQLKSVVTNLVLNAIEAVNDGGRISIATELREDRAVLAVADNGCGMTPEFLEKSLFRPFQTTKKKGIGIGMFQTQMIVEAHRGRIHVESEPQKGTTFRVLLPLHSTT